MFFPYQLAESALAYALVAFFITVSWLRAFAIEVQHSHNLITSERLLILYTSLGCYLPDNYWLDYSYR